MKSNALELSSVQRAALPAKLDIDLSGMVYDVARVFNPLNKGCLLDFQVRALDLDTVGITYVMPKEMQLAFTVFLEAMSGFFRVVHVKEKSTLAEHKAHDLDVITGQNNRMEEFNRILLQTYDVFVSKGWDKKAAIKKTNFILKEKGYEHASYFIVEKLVRDSGRLRRSWKAPI